MSIRQFRPRRDARRGISRSKNLALAILLLVTIALQISYPLVHGDLRTFITIATVYFAAATMLLHALFSYGARYFFSLAFVALTFGFFIELIGSKTGWPFGTYKYSHSLGLAISGVPLVVPFAWLMMLHPTLIAARKVSSSWAFLYGGLLLMAWDLFLDPQMVSAGRWSWKMVGPQLSFEKGVPLSNSAGWLLSGLTAIALLHLLLPKERRKFGADSTIPDLFLAWTFFAGVVGNAFFFNNLALGLIGGLVMGAILAPYFFTLFFGKPDTFN